MIAAAKTLVGRRHSAPVVELASGVCPGGGLAGKGRQHSIQKRRSSWFGRSSRPGTPQASPRGRSTSWLGRSVSRSGSRRSQLLADEPSEQWSLLSSFLRGDLDLLEACLDAIDQVYPVADVLRKISSRGRVKAADWADALGEQFGVDAAFVAKFERNPGSHKRVDRRAALKRMDTICAKTYSRFRKSSVKHSMSSSGGAFAKNDHAAVLHRILGLLSRIMAKRACQEEVSGKEGLRCDHTQGTLEVVQDARDCAQRLLQVASAQCALDVAAVPSPSGYAELLLEHAAASAKRGIYSKTYEDMKALRALLELEPLLVVQSCLHGRPPVAQLLGFVIRSAARGLLLQDRDEATCPDMFGSLEIGLKLCWKLTRLNKEMSCPPRPRRSSFASLFSKPDNSSESDVSNALAAVAAERLLNIIHPQTVYLAFAPMAFLPDTKMVDSILEAGWGFLDESLAADPSCKVRVGLAKIARDLGLEPPGGPPSRTASKTPAAEASRSGAGGAAQSIMELSLYVGRKSDLARSAALYGGAFIMERAVGRFEEMRASLRSSTATSRRASVVSGMRRGSSASTRCSSGGEARGPSGQDGVTSPIAGSDSRHSMALISVTSRTSFEDLQDSQRQSLRSETWSGLSATHRLFSAMRSHMPPFFFEGAAVAAVPLPSEKLCRTLVGQMEQDTKSLRARGWLFPGHEWADLDPEEEGMAMEEMLTSASGSSGTRTRTPSS